MAISLFAFTILSLVAAGSVASSPWPPSAMQRAQALVSQMNLTEKLSLLQGDASLYAGHLPAVTRLGLPDFRLEDSGSGVADGLQQATAFPTTLSVAQSWDPALALAVGDAIGNEMRNKGVNVMLGPGVNLARVPWGGRLYEYMGEDPLLASQLVAAMVTGVQRNNVSTTIKHYLCNNQETNRNDMSADVDDRALMELYLPAYAAAVNAGTGAFMVAVSLVNGTENSANTHTLTDFLLNQTGFLGFMMTDWAGIRVPNASAAAHAGTSVEMPQGYQYQYLPEFIANGSVSMDVINGLVTRVLTAAAAIGLLDDMPSPDRNVSSIVTTPAHAALAKRLAEESAVLLKNDAPAGSATGAPLLPLNISELAANGRGILIVGDENTVVGCGSGQQETPYIITPMEGIFTFVNGNSTGNRTVNCTLFPDVDFFQNGVPCVTTHTQEDCCATCTADSTCNYWTFLPNNECPGQPMTAPYGQCFLKPTNAGYTPHPGLVSGACAPVPSLFPITYTDGSNSTELLQLAAAADVVIVVVTSTGCEGSDRTNLSMAFGDDDMVALAVAANPRTVVVTRCGGACLMPWMSDVPAVLQQGLAGQEAGSALASLLFGAVNPSGKLPLSFPQSEYDTWIQSPAQYPGITQADGWQHAVYSEQLLVGYRWYDARQLEPLFPFGHGLSYTTFNYSGAALNSSQPLSADTAVLVSFNISNGGGRDGAEVAQLYVEYPEAANEPPQLLKGFSKVLVTAAGPPVTVGLPLSYADLAVYADGGWTTVPGNYTLRIGTSSRALLLSLPLVVA